MQLDYSKTIVDVFSESCQRYQDKAAFTCMEHSITYGELWDLSERFAAYLQTHTNLKPGDRIALQLPNILQYPIALFGALRAGFVVVNTNPLYTAHEVKHQLNDAGAKAIVVLANVAKNTASVIKETSVEHIIVTELGDMHPFFKRTLINFVVKHVKKMVPEFSFTKAIKFRDTLSASDATFTPVKINPDDIAILQYTGGTTGVAKGAMLLHRNLVANMIQVTTHMRSVLSDGKDIFITPLPLYHIYSFTVHCAMALSIGANNLLIPNPRDIPAFVKALKGVPFTFFVGLNTLFNALLRNEDFLKLDFSKLTLTASGGMALTTETAHRWMELTKAPLTEGYGLTETSPVISVNPVDGVQIGTVGVPMEKTEIKVIDDAGNALPKGEPGELCVRGPQVMKGYWQRPDATAEVIDADGWFKTGDIAIIQNDNYIKIVDRKKDMINVSGFKVFPNEVEDVLASHPDIVEAAVIGVPDGEGSEVVKAYLVTNNRALTLEDVREFTREKLTGYKRPHLIEFRDELPKSNVGKILRRELRDEELKKAKA
ncbi:MAG: AMP-binding protein [Cellvibrio sp.]